MNEEAQEISLQLLARMLRAEGVSDTVGAYEMFGPRAGRLLLVCWTPPRCAAGPRRGRGACLD